jgi:hypothetical protein
MIILRSDLKLKGKIWKFCEIGMMNFMTNFNLETDVGHKIVLWNWSLEPSVMDIQLEGQVNH